MLTAEAVPSPLLPSPPFPILQAMAKSARNSPLRLAWRRFRKNIPALFGLGWIVLCALVAVFAYLLMPDNTTNANFQIVELPKQPPGTEAHLLLQPNQSDAPQPGALAAAFTGRPDRFTPIPLASAEAVRIQNDSLFWTGLRGAPEARSLVEFLLPMDKFHPQSVAWREAGGHPYQLAPDQSIVYMDLAGERQTASLPELQEQLRETHLESRTFRMGTDSFGRDVFSRLILGTRVSLSVGLMAVLVSLLLGVTLGAVAGFFRGWVDQVIMWIVSVVWSIPTLLLAISISFVLGEGFWQLFLAIGVSMWVEVARIVRGQIFSIREMQYIEATRSLGFLSPRVIFRHILPNILSPLIIVAAANFASAILIEAGLSFLGVGVQAPTPSWGSMIKEGYQQVMFESGSWLAIFPGAAIILVVISLNLVGFGLRDAFDPKYDH